MATECVEGPGAAPPSPPRGHHPRTHHTLQMDCQEEGVRISRLNLELQLGRQRPDLCRLLSSLGLQVWEGEAE